VLLSLVGSREAVGIYGLAYKVVDTIYVLPAFVTLTLLPEFARLTNDTRRRDELVEKASAVMQVAATALVVFAIAFADQIVAIAGGSAFDDAAAVLRILMVGVGLGFLRAVLTEALIAANRQLWLAYAMAALLAANVALNLALIPVLGARGAALAFAASEALALLLVLRLFRRIGTAPRPRRLRQLVLSGAAMAAVTLLQLVPLARDAGPAAVLAVLGPLSFAAFAYGLHALDAMPREVHTALIAPAVQRLRARRRPG
jgi:O-antigen/teichoic acid export membrane protein